VYLILVWIHHIYIRPEIEPLRVRIWALTLSPRFCPRSWLLSLRPARRLHMQLIVIKSIRFLAEPSAGRPGVAAYLAESTSAMAKPTDVAIRMLHIHIHHIDYVAATGKSTGYMMSRFDRRRSLRREPGGAGQLCECLATTTAVARIGRHKRSCVFQEGGFR